MCVCVILARKNHRRRWHFCFANFNICNCFKRSISTVEVVRMSRKPTRIWMKNAFIWFWYFHFFTGSISIICMYSRFFSIFNRFMFFDDSIWLVMLKMSIKCMNTHCVCVCILQPPSTLLTIYRRSHFQESRRDQMNIEITKLIIKKIDDITAEKHSIKRATRPISQIIGICWKLMSTPTKKIIISRRKSSSGNVVVKAENATERYLKVKLCV